MIARSFCIFESILTATFAFEFDNVSLVSLFVLEIEEVKIAVAKFYLHRPEEEKAETKQKMP